MVNFASIETLSFRNSSNMGRTSSGESCSKKWEIYLKIKVWLPSVKAVVRGCHLKTSFDWDHLFNQILPQMETLSVQMYGCRYVELSPLSKYGQYCKGVEFRKWKQAWCHSVDYSFLSFYHQYCLFLRCLWTNFKNNVQGDTESPGDCE